MKEKSIAAGEFKTHCLKLMSEVHDLHRSIVITKHGIPIVKLVPYEKEGKPLFGCLQNTVELQGNILDPIDEQWDVDND